MDREMICPHCQTKGYVKIRKVKKKDGISGGKVLAGLVTSGWSLLATGLSRKRKMTRANCDNCGAEWMF